MTHGVEILIVSKPPSTSRVTVALPLPGIMKAKKKPLEEIPLESLGLDLKTRIHVLKMTAPAGRKGGKKVDSVESLVAGLQHEAKVF